MVHGGRKDGEIESRSDRQNKTLATQNLSDIQIEEVAVENGLDAASNYHNQIKKALHVIAINPVDYVEGTVKTEGKQVMACYGLSLSSLVQHEQLRKNCHRLQID